ncbi:MAG: oxidoreductase [Cyclobacteriaceae bacterium]|nr:MAG: oxidoreductase [Cyclobacteriaceae bacterium]
MKRLIEALSSCIAENRILTGEAVKDRYFHIWQADQPLNALAVVLPKTTQEVSELVKICNRHHQPVVLHGGLTNLVGGTETTPQEVVISFEKMNQIEEVDPTSRTITVQAGVILEHVQKAAAEHGLLFPLNFGARGSAQMGGIISTNAGGLRVLRYGMTRQLVVGLEVVLADGTVISGLKKLIKDNSGYDLKQLFIGSEGTLGIITRAVLKLVEAPKSRISALAGISTYQKVVELLKFMDQGLAGTLSSFEVMWPDTYKVLTTPPANVTPPLPHDHHQYYVLLDSMGSENAGDQIRFQNLLELALEQDMVEDIVPATSASEIDRFWSIRENVDPMVASCRFVQQFDISLPVPKIAEVANGIIENLYRISEVEKVYAFGHIADGNIHLVVGKTNDDDELRQRINQLVYQPLKTVGGSISAEHGIGVHKKEYLHLSRTDEEIELMKILKRALDPENLLNPGKII